MTPPTGSAMSKNWTEEELRQVERSRQQPWTDKVPVSQPAYNKYRVSPAKDREVDGILFDSKREATLYLKLKLMEKAGKIHNLQRQVAFELQPAFEKRGKKFREIRFIADFVFLALDDDGVVRKHVLDAKGIRTKEYIIKKKLFEMKFQDLEIEEI